MELQMKYKRAEDGVIFPWLSQKLPKNKNVIDIGARKGKWYANLEKLYTSSQAHLFEPTPNIVEYLKKHYKGKVSIYDCALSNEDSKLDFHIDLEKGGWSGLNKQRVGGKYKTITVDVKTLDSFKFTNIGLIKIDVEGNEYKTLLGSKETILNSLPFVYFECADVHMETYDNNAGDILDYFESINYNILDLDFNICSLTQFSKHTASDSSFYHNFIACPKQ
jgi:FkbM family methyltransferase